MYRATFLSGAFVAVGLSAPAAEFSFTGAFERDDDVQLFDFAVDTLSTVTLRTYSYAGGTQADGTAIAAGGFDPILAVFDEDGLLLGGNDDDILGAVGTDPVTGAALDSFLDPVVAPGSYTLALSQYDNFPVGSTLAEGFALQGEESFTGAFGCTAGIFCDTTADSRTGAWAVDILGVETAALDDGAPGVIPLPAALPLLAGALGLVGLARRFRKV